MFDRMFNEYLRGGGEETEPEARARKLTETAGYAAAALTLVPIPLTESLVIPIHVGQVVAIGEIYGHQISKSSATDLVLKIGTTVGASFVMRQLATTVAKTLLPGLGGLIMAPFMYASTVAIGAVAESFFKSEGELSSEDMKDVYARTVRQAKQDFDPEKMKSDEIKDLAKAAAEEARGGGSKGEEPEVAEPAPAPAEDPVSRLRRLKALLEEGLIEPSEYDDTKARILADI